jgi:exopolyphosphatase/guanosine-5'-triphosphate,3'-diphosphate pyrophosphatase
VAIQRDSSTSDQAPYFSDAPIAAVDLGSNSFHLLVASYSHGQLKVIDRLREMVRLAAGLDENQRLDLASQTRALDCLARFGERLRDIPPSRLRVVGTNTLREARKADEFIAKAQELLGHELDIISGVEEARLIYVGVSRTLPAIEGEQLIIDIGGGSTEITSGTGFHPGALESLAMGCVAMSKAHFPSGALTAEAFERARTAARLELRPIAKTFRRSSWARCAGASGTIRAAASVLAETALTDQQITVDGLEKLISLLIERQNIDQLEFTSITSERLPVLPGGIAILIEVMGQLGVEKLEVAQGALREGILFDLVGRSSEEDSRTRTIRAIAQRYHVDSDQADRVELTALALLDQVDVGWRLDEPSLRQLLAWAARVHEIGLDIAHAHYHRHGAYLLKHSDLPGFTRNEQSILAALVGAHRRKLVLKDIAAELPKFWVERVTRLALLLRLAVLFNRSRTYELPEMLKIEANRKIIKLHLASEWLQANPLTLADLEMEQAYVRAAGFQLILLTD